jgi:hypothetical protein
MSSLRTLDRLRRRQFRQFLPRNCAGQWSFRCGLSFNLIHFESGFKFDLFIAGRHP